jgi:hypothetical protein
VGGITLVQDEPVAATPPRHPAPPAAEAAELGPRRVRLVFFALMLALLLAALEQMIVATALPRIVGELHGLDKMSWAITAYLLTAPSDCRSTANSATSSAARASSSSPSSSSSPAPRSRGARRPWTS